MNMREARESLQAALERSREAAAGFETELEVTRAKLRERDAQLKEREKSTATHGEEKQRLVKSLEQAGARAAKVSSVINIPMSMPSASIRFQLAQC